MKAGKLAVFGIVVLVLAASAAPSSAARQTLSIYSYSLISADLKITQQLTGSGTNWSFQGSGTATFHAGKFRQSVGALQIPHRFGVLAVPTHGKASWTSAFSDPSGTEDCSGSLGEFPASTLSGVMKVTHKAVHILWQLPYDFVDDCGHGVTADLKTVIPETVVPVSHFKRRTVSLALDGTNTQTGTFGGAGSVTENVQWNGVITLHNCGVSC
jgi:hypothetical protein